MYLLYKLWENEKRRHKRLHCSHALRCEHLSLCSRWKAPTARTKPSATKSLNTKSKINPTCKAMDIDITKVSEKGQVVIPSSIRKEFHLAKGEQLVVIGTGNSIILKRIGAPRRTFEDVVRPIREKARKRGITKKDVEEAIRDVRRSPK